MKKLFLLTFCFLLSSLYAFCQTWAPIGSEWYYSAMAGGLAPTNSEYFHFKVTTDTVIDNYLCSKIDVTYYQYQDAKISKLDHEFTFQNEDTILYYNKFYKKFLPVYIFNVKMGDTLTYFYPFGPNNSGDSTFHILVDSAKTIKLQNLTLQQVYITGIESRVTDIYTERIGSREFFLYQPWGAGIPENPGPIRCYKDDEISASFQNIACDYRKTAGIDELFNKEKIYLYPNPSFGKLFIKNLAYNDFKNYYFEIYNRLGINVKSGFVNNFSTEINIDDLPKGIYFLKIRTNIDYQTMKFIKN